MNSAEFKVVKENYTIYIYCIGKWKTTTIDKIEKEFLNIDIDSDNIVIDFRKIDELDSAAALLIYLFKKNIKI